MGSSIYERLDGIYCTKLKNISLSDNEGNDAMYFVINRSTIMNEYKITGMSDEEVKKGPEKKF